MTPGTPQHRDLFCRTFIESHAAFEPAALPWPDLEPRLLERLRAFPFWSYARSIEHRAGRMVTAFAQTLDDPMIREAVAVQGLEETRHGRLMAHVTERYGIEAPLLQFPDLPAVKEDFLTFGFGECTDSIIGFGGFALSRQKQIFPESLLTIFENVLWEEARHIVFFINWWRYELAQSGRDGLLSHTLDALRYHVRAFAGTAADAGTAATIDLASVQGLMNGVTMQEFLAAALAENRRLMARFDRRLVRPRLVPTAMTIALLALRLLPPRDLARAETAPRLAA
jgi:hypothetical protein